MTMNKDLSIAIDNSAIAIATKAGEIETFMQSCR